MSDCLFCKIANGEIKTDFVYEDENIVAFNDIDPKAPVHILIIPKKHFATLNEINSSSELLMGKIVRVATEIAKKKGFSESGYRLVANCQEGGGQSVFHIHFHLLGGRSMQWPPG